MNYKQWKYNKRDEYYTPTYLVEPLLKYLSKDKVIWCPFDTEDSEYVRVFKNNGIKVIYSHIWNNQNFFNYEPEEHYDIIISNPPFSLKKDILKRLYELDKPFALLLGLPILNYNEIQQVFIDNDSNIQLLMFNKKCTFDGNPSSFNSSYFCKDILPKQIICENIEINYIKSKMCNDLVEKGE